MIENSYLSQAMGKNDQCWTGRICAICWRCHNSGLSGAARALGVEHATSRQVAHLEREIGAKLIDRRGRQILLTAEGVRVAAIAERMSADAMTIGRGGIGADQTHVGEVRIGAPPAYAGAVLAPPLVQPKTAPSRYPRHAHRRNALCLAQAAGSRYRRAAQSA